MSDQVSEYEHVDDFLANTLACINNEELRYVHFVLAHMRKPSDEYMLHDAYMREFPLFVTYQNERFRVTHASRLNLIGLQRDLEKQTGYNFRVPFDLNKLTQWSRNPEV